MERQKRWPCEKESTRLKSDSIQKERLVNRPMHVYKIIEEGIVFRTKMMDIIQQYIVLFY